MSTPVETAAAALQTAVGELFALRADRTTAPATLAPLITSKRAVVVDVLAVRLADALVTAEAARKDALMQDHLTAQADVATADAALTTATAAKATAMSNLFGADAHRVNVSGVLSLDERSATDALAAAVGVFERIGVEMKQAGPYQDQSTGTRCTAAQIAAMNAGQIVAYRADILRVL